jgi:hypothetical protein
MSRNLTDYSFPETSGNREDQAGVWGKSRARERTSATALSSPLCKGGRVIPLWPRIADMKCRGVPDPGGFLTRDVAIRSWKIAANPDPPP